MGAIQGSINQMVGSIAAGAVAGKHIHEQKLIKEETAAAKKATNELEATMLEAEKLPADEAAVEESTKALNTYIEENPDLRDSEDNPLADRLAVEEAAGDDELPDSLTMRSKALSNLQKQQAAKMAVRDATRARIELLRGGKK